MDTITNPGQNQLLKFPAQKAIALTPAIWLALGVVSYNHALLAKAPLRILAPGELADNLSPERWQALEAGHAAIADATALSPSSLNAAVRITRTLLEPLSVTVTLLGSEPTRKYLLLEFHAREVSKSLNPQGSKPRILPAHDYPSNMGGEPDRDEKAS
jgi:hypothetical protein